MLSAHVLASAQYCNGVGECSWFVRVSQQPIPNSIFSLLFPLLVKLLVRTKAESHYEFLGLVLGERRVHTVV